MPTYYYQIKGRDADGHWTWPPLYSNKREASSSKELRAILEEEHGMKLPGRATNDKDQAFLLSIDDITNKSYLLKRFDAKICEVCAEFTDNDKYLVNAGGSTSFCSGICMQEKKNQEGILLNANFDFTGIHKPVIYRISSRMTGQSYIGKTTQAFTLRWYQHFFQSSGTKFHQAIRLYGLTDWKFEVVEVIDCKKDVLNETMVERECYWIRFYDSINNGYNSVIPKKDDALVDDLPNLFTLI